ncbi:hypothetical protein [Vagococcus hydrophili]|uniref:Uncharacterized protein n=1 Tax=Vagococcus hydrophili TaxID=2714947 RepID=A0A6G8ATG2_9ENTE|nr:hypothetical protein [Vagococcus hydrophili]QIL48232.1 hypothetical protein G7082_06880 [Vagococcus hydrophili]
MKIKKIGKELAIIVVLAVIWGVYYYQAYPIFAEVTDLITPGSSYIVKILEFTNYRAEQLSFILIEFFLLTSISSILSLYIYKTIEYTKNKVLLGLIVINIVFVGIICVIANIFWSVYLILTVLSLLIIAASVYVSSVLFGSAVKFDEGEVVYTSKAFETEDLAQDSLNNRINQLDKKAKSKLDGEVFEDNKQYFFEIYANDRIILDNKGEFNFHEKI